MGVVMLVLGTYHLCRLHLDQTLTRALFNLFLEHLRGDLHLLCRHRIAGDAMVTMGIFLRRTTHVGALLWTRAHLLIMRQLAYHSGALRCAESARVCRRWRHSGHWVVMRVMSLTYGILLRRVKYQLLSLLRRCELWAWMKFFKSCLVFQSAYLVWVLYTRCCEACLMLVLAHSNVWRQLWMTWLVHSSHSNWPLSGRLGCSSCSCLCKVLKVFVHSERSFICANAEALHRYMHVWVVRVWFVVGSEWIGGCLCFLFGWWVLIGGSHASRSRWIGLLLL